MKGSLISCTSLCYAMVIAILLSLGSCDLVDYTCTKTPNKQLCLSVLRPDPRSHGADVTGLGLILVDAVKNEVTSSQALSNQLLKSKPEFKVPLSLCSKIYDFILKYDVAVAIEALQKGDPKFGEDGMNDSVVEVQECEDGFKSYPSSPLAPVNKAVADLSQVAAAIIRLLL